MDIIQNLYCTVLNHCFSIISKLPSKLRNEISFICVFLLVLLSYYGEAKDYMKGPPITTLCILQSILLILIVVMSIEAPLHKIRWNKVMPASWFLFSLIVVLTSFDHVIGPGFRPMAFMMLLLYPALFIVWNNRKDYQVLFEMVSKATIIVMLTFFIMCVFYNPLTIEDFRYTGFTGNPGSLGKIGVAGLTCGLYLTINMRKNYWLYALFCGMASTLVMLSMSRTAMVAMGMLFLFFMLFCIKEVLRHSKIRKRLLSRVIVITIILIAAYPLTTFLLTNGYAILQETYQINLKIFNGTETNQETVPSPKTETQAPLNATQAPDKMDLAKERLSLDGKDLNTYTAGRMLIYKARFPMLNLKGHDATDSIYIEGYGRNRWSHNTVLEFAYRSGIIAGGLFFLIELLSAIYVFRKLFSREKVLIYQYFVFFAIIGFGIMSLTDVIFTPAADPGVLYYFLAMMPLFCRKSKKKE